jgi:hypothetical protein
LKFYLLTEMKWMWLFYFLFGYYIQWQFLDININNFIFFVLVFVVLVSVIIPNIIRILLCWLCCSLTDEQWCLYKDLKLKKCVCKTSFICLRLHSIPEWGVCCTDEIRQCVKF